MELNRENLNRLNTLYHERDEVIEKIAYFSEQYEVMDYPDNSSYSQPVPGSELRKRPGVLFTNSTVYRKKGENSRGETVYTNEDFNLLPILKTVPETEMILGLVVDSILRALRKRLEEVEAEILSIK
jgi:hypothetical protein